MQGGGSAGAGPTKEQAAAIARRLAEVRKADEGRWEAFVERFGKKVAAAPPVRGPGGIQPKADAVEEEEAEAAPAVLRASDIPWPGGFDAGKSDAENGNVLSLAPTLAALEVKAIVRAAQRQWHPDKFAQRFGRAMEGLVGGEAEREAVLEKVKLLAQQINAIEIPAEAEAEAAGGEENVGPARPAAT